MPFLQFIRAREITWVHVRTYIFVSQFLFTEKENSKLELLFASQVIHKRSGHSLPDYPHTATPANTHTHTHRARGVSQTLCILISIIYSTPACSARKLVSCSITHVNKGEKDTNGASCTKCLDLLPEWSYLTKCSPLWISLPLYSLRNPVPTLVICIESSSFFLRDLFLYPLLSIDGISPPTQKPSLKRLPDPEKAFQLYVHEKEAIALGVLIQRLGPEHQPVAYLSKKLNQTTLGWPPCLWNFAATSILIEDAFGESISPNSLLGKINYFLPATKWNNS